MSIKTETETVVKKILPYLERRGYDVVNDLDFETSLTLTDNYTKGYIDILVTLGGKRPLFLIEAKRTSKKLTNKDRDQAISYAISPEIDVPFVVVTNGTDILCFNSKNKKRILWDGKTVDKIPSKEQVKKVVKFLRANSQEINIGISNDESLPFRPSLPLRQLNALFYKGHSTIRKIEKDEESAFSDFSKLLFLRLLEERSDLEEGFELPYSFRFYKLAETPAKNADQVKVAIKSMIASIIDQTAYGEVLEEPIRIHNPRTYLSLVKDLASVSFSDCSLDSKGAAFEYYVRATLKGKKLGQYFTPRELVQVMSILIGENKIVNAVLSSSKIKVLDPACGTGGFIVYLMKDAISKLEVLLKKREITKETFDKAVKTLKESVFFGSDANKGVAAAAKMNMIIAGDGHTNIRHEDSLSDSAQNWSTKKPDCQLILTNPPFGTTEGDSLTDKDMGQFEVSTTKGQYLFLQKMINCTESGGEICTVIDEGVLNTDSGKLLRAFILQNCRVIAVINLPGETFKPNKINVRSSLLYLQKRESVDTEFEDKYKVTFCQLTCLGYEGSGSKIRGFDTNAFLSELKEMLLDQSLGSSRSGYHWKAFDVDSSGLSSDTTYRLDYKYWDTEVRNELVKLMSKEMPTIGQINLIDTCRGKSPTSDSYVDEGDGYALVIKAGSSISKFGELVVEDSDWIEKSVYDEYVEKAEEQKCNINIVKFGDVLLASTGTGTLGKCCVYNLRETPAIADGHVTIIRVDPQNINPYYLADYLRNGFGAVQIERLYTGSTGLIELTPEQASGIIIDTKFNVKEQYEISKKLRRIEQQYNDTLVEADKLLKDAQSILWIRK